MPRASKLYVASSVLGAPSLDRPTAATVEQWTRRLAPLFFTAPITLRVPSTLARTIAGDARRVTPTCAAQWKTTSTPRNAASSFAASSRSASTHSTPTPSRCDDLVLARRVARTAWPLSRSATARLAPSSPDAPVIAVRMIPSFDHAARAMRAGVPSVYDAPRESPVARSRVDTFGMRSGAGPRAFGAAGSDRDVGR